jgi:hypothetical protein
MLRKPVEQQRQRLGPNRSRAREIAALFADLTGVSPRLAHANPSVMQANTSSYDP